MNGRRKLLAGVSAALLLAGGATGAALAAAGHGGSVVRSGQAPPFRVTEAGFVRASAYYLGLDVATLRHEVKGGRTIADIANSTSGTSAQKLTAYLVAEASTRLQQIADRALLPGERLHLRSWLQGRVSGFLNDTCPLSLAGLKKRLAGCHGMSMSA